MIPLINKGLRKTPRLMDFPRTLCSLNLHLICQHIKWGIFVVVTGISRSCKTLVEFPHTLIPLDQARSVRYAQKHENTGFLINLTPVSSLPAVWGMDTGPFRDPGNHAPKCQDPCIIACKKG